MAQRFDDKFVMKLINRMGLKSNPPFKCINSSIPTPKGERRKIELQNLKTKEKVIRQMKDIKYGRNPWARILSNQDIIKEVNRIGAKSNPSFRCSNPKAPQRAGNGRDIELQNIATGQKVVRKLNDIQRGKNPFGCKGPRIDNNQVIKDLNKIGAKSNPKFKCTNPMISNGGKIGHRLVEIMNLETKVKLVCAMGNLKAGKNPWNKSQDRVELQKIHPMYKRVFNKHKIEYKYNFRLGTKFIDFIFKSKKGWIGLEVKQSKEWYSEKNQISSYRQLGSLKQYGLRGVILSDPKGSHKAKGSISIKELEARLVKGL